MSENYKLTIMKELSIEEKVKRYDEVIEKGKQIQNTPYTAHWDIMKEVVEHLLPELREENPAWSEEDEFELENVLCHLRNYLHKDSYIRYENWLKSLKDRIQPKPKWSEEDEKMLNQIIKDYERGNESWLKSQGSLPFGNRITWLKSIRPQNTWKPSVFHLECISDAIAIYEKRGINAIGLKEILEELKKLREK